MSVVDVFKQLLGPLDGRRLGVVSFHPFGLQGSLCRKRLRSFLGFTFSARGLDGEIQCLVTARRSELM